MPMPLPRGYAYGAMAVGAMPRGYGYRAGGLTYALGGFGRQRQRSTLVAGC